MSYAATLKVNNEKNGGNICLFAAYVDLVIFLHIAFMCIVL